MNNNKITDSEKLALLIRKDVLEMIHNSGASHIASALSVTDIVSVLYANILKYDVNNPNEETRDRLILSKGHAGSALYAALAEEGFFDKEELKTYYQNGSRLSGHVSQKNVPGIEFSTGSLGHGMSVAAGIAMAAKIDNKKFTSYVIVGDGECDEGAVWECALFANQFKLSNLVVIVDANGMQAMGKREEVMSLEPFEEKWKSFGWNAKTVDGHNHKELTDAILECKHSNKPNVIIARTIKGKGISFMENELVWHYRPPMGEDYENAIKELEVLKK